MELFGKRARGRRHSASFLPKSLLNKALPAVSVHINGCKRLALVDTGCTQTLVRKACCNAWEKKKVPVLTVGGGSLVCCGVTVVHNSVGLLWGRRAVQYKNWWRSLLLVGFIFFLLSFKLRKNAAETYGMLQTAFGASYMNQASVFEWHKRFKESRESVRDDERCGRSKEVNTPELIGQRVRLRVTMLRF